MKKYYFTIGFMGSGSSAMADFLREFDGIDAPNGYFEYVFLYAPNGVFDLEDKLLCGNNALRSDEAIHSFKTFMEDLYYKKHYWVADYKNKVSKDFISYVDAFINALNPISLNQYWYYTQNPNSIMTLKRMIRKLIYLITLKKVLLAPPLRYKEMLLAYPSKIEFYSAAKNFVYKVMKDIKGNNEAVVLDQFVLPHNLFRFNNYFDDDAVAIVTDRDPRDVFISNKYFWVKKNIASPFPTDVDEFCIMYKKMRDSIRNYDKGNVIFVQFEDLVYNYEQTEKYLCSKLQLSTKKHTKRKKCFNPSISIVNTNLQRLNPMYAEEAKVIEMNLGEYIYDFNRFDIEIKMNTEVF